MIYLYMLILARSPFLCLFGIIIPAITTGIVYRLLTVDSDLSLEKVKIVLVIVFVLTAIVSCSSFFYLYFRDNTPIMD
jgi:hypothetical protein